MSQIAILIPTEEAERRDVAYLGGEAEAVARADDAKREPAGAVSARAFLARRSCQRRPGKASRLLPALG